MSGATPGSTMGIGGQQGTASGEDIDSLIQHIRGAVMMRSPLQSGLGAITNGSPLTQAIAAT